MINRTRVALVVLMSFVLSAPLSAGQARANQNQPNRNDRADRRAMRFQGMDVNKDGVITRDEWRGSERSFERRDSNRDGVLSGSEVWSAGVPQGTSGTYQTADPTNPMAESFLRADRNHDGIISRNEWTSDPTTFTRVDINGDGVITRPEYLGEGWVAESTAAPTAQGQADARRDSRAYQSGFDRGLADGRQAGKEDQERRNQWDLEGQRELEQADAGYEAAIGARTDYQAGYRAGFRAGYRQGFGPRS